MSSSLKNRAGGIRQNEFPMQLSEEIDKFKRRIREDKKRLFEKNSAIPVNDPFQTSGGVKRRASDVESLSKHMQAFNREFPYAKVTEEENDGSEGEDG